MLFYFGRTHSAQAVHQTILPYLCPLCDFAGYAFITTAAVGTARSPFLIGAWSGARRAHESAKKKARSNATRVLYQLECPDCEEIANKAVFRVRDVDMRHLITLDTPDEEALAYAISAAGLTLEQVGADEEVTFSFLKNGSIRLGYGDEVERFKYVNDAIKHIHQLQKEAGTDGSEPGPIEVFCDELQHALNEATDAEYEAPVSYLMDIINDEDLDERCELEWYEDGSRRSELGIVEDPNGTLWSIWVKSGRLRHEPVLDDV